MSRLTLGCPAGSEEDNVDCILVGGKPLCKLVNVELIDVVLLILVLVMDKEDSFSLVVNDSVTDNCDKVEVVNALIRLLADFLHAI